MAYSVKRLALLAGIRRKTLKFRPQYLNAYDELGMAKAVLMPVVAWEGQRNTILLAYAAALSQMTRDSAEGDMNAVLLTASEVGQRVTLNAELAVKAWIDEYAPKHARKFAAAVKAQVKLDPFPYIDLAANADDLDVFRQRVANLITDVSDQARKEVSEVVWRNLINRTHPRVVAKEVAERLGVVRSRALFIASDQANKVHAKLTQIRQQEGGIDKFMWETAKDSRVRPEHVALQGRVFSWSKPPAVGLPGTPIRCRCTGAAYIDMDEDE